MEITYLINQYKELSFMKKLSLWGAISSITGILATLSPLQAESINQNINGNQNNLIHENNGTINIQQELNQDALTKSYVLRNLSTGSVLLVSKPEVLAAIDLKYHVCMAPAGTDITLTGKKANISGIDLWREVRVKSGECSGEIGWTTIENINYQ